MESVAGDARQQSARLWFVAHPFLTSSPASCKSRVQANKRRINGCGCLTEAVRIDPRRTPRTGNPAPSRNTRLQAFRRSIRPPADCPADALPRSSGRHPPAAPVCCLGSLPPPPRARKICALVDAEDAFSPHSAADAGVQLERLLWVRCGHSAEHALKAADLLIQGGGFGLVVMDLGDTPPQHRAPHLADFLVPPAPRGGTYADRAALSRATIQRQDLRVAGDRVRPQGGQSGPARVPSPACCAASRCAPHPLNGGSSVRLSSRHGQSDRARLRILAHRGSHGCAQWADTVTFDVSGLDRLFGLPQDVAAAIARRAREIGVKANLALAGNPDAAICAARGFPGVSLIPHGDEGKFLATLPLTLLSPLPNCSKRWSAGAYAASTKWRRCRRSASRNGSAQRDCGCANWRAAKAIASCCRSQMRSISKTRSSWIIRWNCWSRWPSCWPA